MGKLLKTGSVCSLCIGLLCVASSCSKDSSFSTLQASSLSVPNGNDSAPLPGDSNDNPGKETPGSPPAPPEYGRDPVGLTGGHFDLDTSHLVYAPNQGTTDHHVHEYDDKYHVTGADFFDLHETGLGNIDTEISNRSQRFVLIVANAELSPGAYLYINGTAVRALDYQKELREQLAQGAAPASFALSSMGDGKTTELTGLKVGFFKDAIEKGGLIPTATGCVRKNRPGKLGEYRNGALVIQAVAVDGFALDPATGTATAASKSLLWEATLFWHRDGTCYGASD